MEDKKTKKEEKDEASSQHYELIYLISNKYSENELEPIKNNVVKLIRDNGGEITYQEDWGKRKLAYPIKHFFHAYYELLEFDFPSENLKKVDKDLRLSEEIIRYLIIRKKMKTEAEIKQEKRIAEKIAQKKIKEEKEEKDEKKKVSMEELDEKLDKILDTEDLNI